MATYFVPVMSEHVLQTNYLGSKTHVRRTHITLFIISVVVVLLSTPSCYYRNPVL